ncbi:hypothetical protein C0991_007971 [Blastosporella zonata]|nr:hypothetical protein C0991_007971 [Blastosporella zonata]
MELSNKPFTQQKLYLRSLQDKKHSKWKQQHVQQEKTGQQTMNCTKCSQLSWEKTHLMSLAANVNKSSNSYIPKHYGEALQQLDLWHEHMDMKLSMLEKKKVWKLWCH